MLQLLIGNVNIIFLINLSEICFLKSEILSMKDFSEIFFRKKFGNYLKLRVFKPKFES